MTEVTQQFEKRLKRKLHKEHQSDSICAKLRKAARHQRRKCSTDTCRNVVLMLYRIALLTSRARKRHVDEMLCSHGQHILRVCFQGEPQHCVGALQNIRHSVLNKTKTSWSRCEYQDEQEAPNLAGMTNLEGKWHPVFVFAMSEALYHNPSTQFPSARTRPRSVSCT